MQSVAEPRSGSPACSTRRNSVAAKALKDSRELAGTFWMGQMAALLGPRRFQARGIGAKIATARSLSILAHARNCRRALCRQGDLPSARSRHPVDLRSGSPAARASRLGDRPHPFGCARRRPCVSRHLRGVGSFVGQQAVQLAEKLPQYQFTIQQKVHALSVAASGERWRDCRRSWSISTTKSEKKNPASTQTAPGSASAPPIPVRFTSPRRRPFRSYT